MRTSGQADPECGDLHPAGEQPFPDLDALASEADEQGTSLFLSKLPIELRNAIYGFLWRDAGLEQHILVDKDWGPKQTRSYAYPRREIVPEVPITRFSHWACISDHTALDERQEAIARLTSDEIERDVVWDERLNSAWCNHWKCQEAHQTAVNDLARPCQRSPFLPMMLVCRRIHLECRKSIYKALTFVIHDAATLHSFLVARRSPIVDEIKRFNLSIRLPIRTSKIVISSEEAKATMSLWQASCQALPEARSLVSVYLWLETFPNEDACLLRSVPAVNPYVFDSRLASILTVDIPASPSRPGVWKDIADIRPPFKIRARGWPRYSTDPGWDGIRYDEDGWEPGDPPRPRSQPMECGLIRLPRLKKIR
ncbi:uncharacterized protein PG986_001827 [Apiospora aurea]|uniref:Uncharacterized protein n=1 Tax=Apiospora aurea TaxID=335848 RepID=A0ABR1QXZ1_9PEZI